MTDEILSKNTLDSKQEKMLGEGNSYSSDAVDIGISVGKRLRQIRTLQGISLRSLSKKSGLNINTLSLMENERTSPSVSTLQQLAQTLKVNITDFFECDLKSKNVVYQKQGKRTRIAFTHSYMEDLAIGMLRFGAEPIIVTLLPNASSGKNPIVHTGREFVYCLEGYITYTVDNVSYWLEPGDSLFFEAYLPHLWKNTVTTPSRILLVLCPVDERDQPRDRHFTR